MRRWGILLGVIMALAACSDEVASSGDGAGGAGEQDARSRPVTLDAGGLGGAGGGGGAGGAGGMPPMDAGLTPDAAPVGGCVIDEDCGAESVCSNGRCIEGTRCIDFTCPAGRICLSNVCVPDPRSSGGLVVDPGRIIFPFANAAERVVRGVALLNESEDVLTVARLGFTGAPVFSLDPPPELPLRLVPGQRVELTVVYVADDDQDDQGTMEATLDVPGADPVEVELFTQHKVVGGNDPCLTIEPARLDFGAVARGADRTMRFELVSCGLVPVTVNGIRRGQSIFGALPDTFQLTNPPGFPVVLPPNARQAVEVTYAPRRAGIEGGNWDVFSTDAANPQQRVDVSALANPPPLQDIAMHIRLNWTSDLTDVDLHLLGPGGVMWTCEGDCYFSNGNPNWGDPNDFRDDPFLDVDDVDGFGPENINLEAPAPGTYRVVVQYWDEHDGWAPDATVEILEFGQVVASYGPVTFNSAGEEWDVVDIEWPARNFVELGNVQSRNQNGLCGGF
jgi:hypothetical protein